jgi:hypothetical protein
MIAQKNLGLMKLKFVIRRHPPVFLRSRLVCLAWLVNAARLAAPLSFRHRTLADQRENPKSLAGQTRQRRSTKQSWTQNGVRSELSIVYKSSNRA